MVLLSNLARFAYNSYLSVIYFGELDFAEGIVWQQARPIPSSRMYGDLQEFPFIVFNYPPLYYVVANTLSAAGASWLVAARTVSVVSLCVTAAMAGLIVIESSRRPGDTARSYLDLTGFAPLIPRRALWSPC